MPRVTTSLTNTEVEKAKPKDKEYSLADGQGLFLRVRPSGSKTWLFNYIRPALKKRNNLAIGSYTLEQKDFKQDVSLFYARARNRHRWYGIDIPIYTFDDGTSARFRIEIENTLFYGLPREFENAENKVLEGVSTAMNLPKSPYWYAWKWFDRNSLNFWSMDSEAFERLNHPIKREALMDEIAEELECYIKQMQARIQNQEAE